MNLTYPLILGSKSPRRKEILEKAGFQFHTEAKDTAENYNPAMDKTLVASYLSEIKAKAFQSDESYADKIVLTADTTVLLDNELLEKPVDAEDAFRMLSLLSGRQHEVISAFSILHQGEIKTINDTTKVFFSEISEAEIRNYISLHKPFDKAGAYGIQEGIGLTHIHQLEGSYFTVMGLSIHKVYQALLSYKA